MEFFRTINIVSSESEIQEELTLNNVEMMSSQVFVIGPHTQENAPVGSIWGEFTLSRQEIKGGVRFSLVECPNALAWTLTTGYPPSPNFIILHLTINRKEKDQEFIEELIEFMDDIENSVQQLDKVSTSI